jgi:NAD(P)-dependent dehydrogenase (short-subunit alcohol dehydrogenase family)
VVTGVTRGLGRAIYDGLLSTWCAGDQKIFISRGIVPRVSANGLVHEVARDLAQPDFDVSGITIHPRATQIVFVSNAAVIGPIVRATEATTQDLLHSVQVNVAAPLRLAQHLASLAQARGVGLHILDVSSGAASRPIAGWLYYCVGKAAAVMALDVLAAENSHVQVTHFNPGVMDTEMQATIRAATEHDMPDVEQYRQLKAQGVLKPPAAVAAEVCAWLAQRD